MRIKVDITQVQKKNITQSFPSVAAVGALYSSSVVSLVSLWMYCAVYMLCILEVGIAEAQNVSLLYRKDTVIRVLLYRKDIGYIAYTGSATPH